jgi:hypothetical protein
MIPVTQNEIIALAIAVLALAIGLFIHVWWHR